MNNTNKTRILAVDDKTNMLRLLERIFSDQHEVTTCSRAAHASHLIREKDFDVVISDVRMPELSGIDLLRIIKSERPLSEVILVTAYGDIPQAVEAMREGAFDYITKPFDPEELKNIVNNALRARQQITPTHLPQQDIEEKYTFHNIVGSSMPMQCALALLRKSAETDATVLLLGESGTGKELFARAIHECSKRAQANFVPVNCGAIPRELLESELFGHIKGSFTSAMRSSKGLFEEADTGTIFLDEIAELDLDLQVKITRVIQEREVRAVGETRGRKLDVRIVAASNRDLSAAVQEGNFREDLYYRLRVFPIVMPPLRERSEDIPLLVTHFLRRFTKREAKKVETIEPAALKLLIGHEWPGNVRELENTIERAVLLEESDKLTRAVIADCIDRSRAPAGNSALAALPYREAMELAQEKSLKDYVAALLKQEGGNVTRAAKRAGIERESFHRLMRRCGMQSSEFKE